MKLVEYSIIDVPDTVRESILRCTKEPRLNPRDLPGSGSIVSGSSDGASASPRRRVMFQEEQNIKYEGIARSIETFWYTNDEIVNFYNDAKRVAGTLQAAETLSQDPQFWTRLLLRDYQMFCSENDADLEGVIGARSAFYSSALTGIAIWAIPTIDKDSQNRYKQMQKQIDSLQRSCIVSEDRRAEFIRRAARTWSRPARLFAQHTAMAAACQNV